MKQTMPNNFCGLDEEYSGYKNSKIVIFPFPFDKTSTWGKGADKGPGALISASQNLELYDIETGTEVYRRGIFTDKPLLAVNPESMAKRGYERVKKYLKDDKFVVTIGGEHSISYGPIKAYAEKYPQLSILHFDAHSDRRDTYHGSKHNHACILARAQEMAEKIVSVGIRSLDIEEKERLSRDTIIYGSEVHKGSGWRKKAADALSNDVYITIDLDVFDPAIMPSTGTPEPGGMWWHQVVDFLREISKKKNIVGFDVTELCPTKQNRAPDFLAAKLVYTLLSYLFAGK